MFSRFDTILACDGRTDGRTDVKPIAITCFSIADARKNTKARTRDTSLLLPRNIQTMRITYTTLRRRTTFGFILDDIIYYIGRLDQGQLSLYYEYFAVRYRTNHHNRQHLATTGTAYTKRTGLVTRRGVSVHTCVVMSDSGNSLRR